MYETNYLLYPIIAALLVFISVTIFAIKQYHRCPPNSVLVVFGKITGTKTAKCIHGGGTFIIPLFQDYGYLSLKPTTIDIDLTSALSKNNIRVNVPSTFTIGVSTQPDIMSNAAERLLALDESQISAQANDIILGQLRLVVATLSIEEINQDREKFLSLINENVGIELNKIGLEVINVNIRDLTDESGYITAIGQKAAATAINKAKVEVAEQVKEGDIGEARANREKDVQVANERAESTKGTKAAEKEERVGIAKLDAEAIAGEAEADKNKDIAVAVQASVKEQGQKQAELEQRVKVASLESEAVDGENTAQAKIADSNATLKEKQASAARKAEVAEATASRDILLAEKEEELARLAKVELAPQEVEKQRIEIEAEAEAEKQRRIAKGEADAVLLKYQAEAEGTQKVLEAKAMGYQNLIQACGNNGHFAPTLLMIEKLPEIVSEQVKAISNLKIDKITVWDGGSNEPGKAGSTANFLSGMISSLPAWHEVCKQAGIDLPEYLGSVNQTTPNSEKENEIESVEDLNIDDTTKV